MIATPGQPDYVVACLRTGYNKSHIVRTLGAFDTGFTVVFVPLLTLSADLLANFTSADQRYGTVRTYHLDELHTDNQPKYDEFLKRCYATDQSCRDTNFVFISPHFLVRHTHRSGRSSSHRLPANTAQRRDG